MALEQKDIEKIAQQQAREVIKSACRCATSFNLILLLTGTAMDWTRDEIMRKWVADHMQRIDNGLNYLEQDCQCKVPEAKRSVEKAIGELETKNWQGVRSNLDDAYIHIDRAIVHCAGYVTPHF